MKPEENRQEPVPETETAEETELEEMLKEEPAEEIAEPEETPAETEKEAEEKEEEKPVKKKKGKEEEIVEERFYTIPLGKASVRPPKKRAPRAIHLVRAFITKHMKLA